MKKGHSVAGENRNVSLGATANQIIYHGYFVPAFAEMKCDTRTNETAAAGHEYVQEIVLLSRYHFCGTLFCNPEKVAISRRHSESEKAAKAKTLTPRCGSSENRAGLHQ